MILGAALEISGIISIFSLILKGVELFQKFRSQRQDNKTFLLIREINVINS
jgi:hypothetical protein